MIGRHSIDNPMVIDLSSMPVPPLRFVIQPSYEPVGLYEAYSEGFTVAHTPWYTELGLSLNGADSAALLYLIPKDDDTNLLVACLDRTLDPLFDLLVGPDYGDELVELVAQHWPDIYEMLRNSQDLAATFRMICNVRTPGHLQWVVADPLRGKSKDEWSSERILDLIGTSLQTMFKFTDFPIELPGAVYVLGGPNQLSRRLSALSGLLNASGDIAGVLQGGISSPDLIKLAIAAKNFLSTIR